MTKDDVLVGFWFVTAVTFMSQVDPSTLHWSGAEAKAKSSRDSKDKNSKPKARPTLGNKCKGEGDTPDEARRLSFCLAKKLYGWKDKELVTLNNLWTWESGFNYRADNPVSTAIGIPQCLASAHPECYSDAWVSNPRNQILWGLSYLKARYGTPASAWSLHQQRSPHWY